MLHRCVFGDSFTWHSGLYLVSEALEAQLAAGSSGTEAPHCCGSCTRALTNHWLLLTLPLYGPRMAVISETRPSTMKIVVWKK